jgi:hypothetical protein
MIEEPAFIHIDMLNGSRVTGKAVRFSDPTNANQFGALICEFADGSIHYVLWNAILRVSVFPLSLGPPPE